jgi:hypothetical protein
MNQAEPNRGPFVWILDGSDRIIQVNDNWLDFARDNCAPELTRERVLGQPLRRFISGEETLQTYRIIFARLRANLKPVKIPFRCDSPDCRRFMTMKLTPLAGDAIEFRSILLKTEKRAPLEILSEVPRSDEFLKMCSWCKKVQLASGEWVEIEEGVKRLDLFAHRALPRFTHAICPDCASLLNRLPLS